MVEPSVIPRAHWSQTVLADEQSTFAAIAGSTGADTRDTLRRRIVTSLLCAILGAGGFGVALGVYARSAPQTFLSAVKAPLLLLGTAAICFPAFYVLQRLRAPRPISLAQALALQTSSLGAVGIVWASLAPPILLLVGTAYNYTMAQTLALAVGAIGGAVGLRRLVLGCRALNGTGQVRGTSFLWIYALLFGCVGAQLSWVLRPFIGSPSLEFQLFRPLGGSIFTHILEMLGA
jgi:hypothetical protein